MSGKLFYAGAIGFVIGVLARSFLDLGFAFPVFIMVLAGGVFLAGKLVHKGVISSTKITPSRVFAAIFLLSLALGIARLSLADLNRGNAVLDRMVNEQVTLKGFVSEEPDIREASVLLTVNLTELVADSAQNAETIPLTSRALVIAAPFPQFSYGDEVKLRGRLALPKSFAAEGRDKLFDYGSYLAREGIYYLLYKPRIELIEHGHGNVVKRVLFSLKEKFLRAASGVLPEPENSLLGGLIVGTKQSLGTIWLDLFRRVGIIHVVVLSGYNLTVVASFIMKIFSFLPRRLPLVFGAFSIILFAIMTGGSATVVRASIMVLIALLGKATGRPYAAGRALIIAGLIMLVQNPKILVFDPSFQLSFLATLGLVYLTPVFERRLKFLPKHFGIREITATTIGTQLAVLPLLLYQTGIFSVVSLPANLLVLPLIPPAMLSGFITGLIAFVSPTLALPAATVTYGLLTFVFFIAKQLGQLSFASITVSSFPFWFTVLLYGALIIFVWRAKKREEGSSAASTTQSSSVRLS